MEQIINILQSISTFEKVIIGIVIFLQLYIFVKTWIKSLLMGNIFPSNIQYKIKLTKINKDILTDSTAFEKYAEKGYPECENGTEVEIIECGGTITPLLNEILKTTNSYLCKNKGTAADFTIIKDISERRIEALQNEIQSTINVPLYLGLAGTFVGIICGISGINFDDFIGNADMSSLDKLLGGVVFAMLASFLGLILTTFNSAWVYKNNEKRIDTNKNRFYDFIQRELMPILAVGVSGSLASLKSVLGHFVDQFGVNVTGYADSARLLNENLDKQQTVLEELNKLSLTRTANAIASTFATLKESSDELLHFKEYQVELNNTIRETTKVSSDLKDIIASFRSFSDNLKVMSDSSAATIELQQQFKNSLEVHFPTISDHREVWRKEIDMINTDTKLAADELFTYLKNSSEYIRNFVDSNQEYFTTVSTLNSTVESLSKYAGLQKDCYIQLQGEIHALRDDIKRTNENSLNLNKDLITAIKALCEKALTDEENKKVLKEVPDNEE